MAGGEADLFEEDEELEDELDPEAEPAPISPFGSLMIYELWAW
jgi:hypothetical protein